MKIGRSINHFVIGGCISICFCSSDAPGKSDLGKPNVILIIADDLNDAVTVYGGHPQARTPNIDKLASMGFVFNNAHSNDPVCGPSRASMLTGVYPHNSGYYGIRQDQNHWYNYPELKKATSIFEHFSQNGYNVYGTGKLFHNQRGQKERLIRDDGFDGNSDVHPSHGPFAYNGKQFIAHPSIPLPFGQGDHAQFESFGPLSNVPVVTDDSINGIPGYVGWFDFKYEDDENRDLMADEAHAQWAREVLRKEHDAPFMLAVGFHRPHSPWYAPQKFFDMFPLDDIKLPPYLASDLDDCADILQQPNSKSQGYALSRFERLDSAYNGQEGWNLWMQAYLACVAFVDEQVGVILDALEESQYHDNTIVVLTSDHGFHMGEKNRIWKNSLWEESTRVPLIISLPDLKNEGVEINKPVSLIDIYPTLSDLCNLIINPEQNLDGYSLKPFIINPEADWEGPDVALSCINGQINPGQNTPGKTKDQHFSVRSERYRYILCSDGEEELYDHYNDPNEWNNLANNNEYEHIKIHMNVQLMKLLESN